MEMVKGVTAITIMMTMPTPTVAEMNNTCVDTPTFQCGSVNIDEVVDDDSSEVKMMSTPVDYQEVDDTYKATRVDYTGTQN